MIEPFRRVSATGIEVTLDDHEREFLRDLVSQLVELVESSEPGAGESADPHADELAAMVGIGTATHLPLDPTLARLFPDAYHDDAIAAGDFRRYTELRLRDRKARNAASTSASLERSSPVVLDEAEIGAWLGTLNDLRLVLGTLLDVAEEDDVEERLAEPEGDSYRVYLWLTHLQGSFIEALDEPPG